MISVIVISYNSAELLGTCLRPLAESEVPHEVIIVDNASPDGSADRIADDFPKANLVRLPVNVGFGRAVNEGARRATGEWLLLINPDAEPVGDVLAALVAATRRDPGRGFYAGRTLRQDGADDGRSISAMPSLWSMTCFATGLSTMFRRSSLVNPEELPGLDRAKPTVVPVASGCVLLINRARFEELGGFTPDYFMYSEDVDICHRHGAGVAYVPEAKVLHVNGASSGTTARKLVMLLRGKTTFVRLHWSPGRAALGRWLLTTGVGARAFGSLLTGRAPMWREMWRNRAVWLAGWPPVATDR